MVEWLVYLKSYFDVHAALQAIGVIGFLFYIGGFAALQFGMIDGNGVAFTSINILGASFVLLSLITAFNLASLLIQVSWIMIGGVGIYRHLIKTRTANRKLVSPPNANFQSRRIPRPLAVRVSENPQKKMSGDMSALRIDQAAPWT